MHLPSVVRQLLAIRPYHDRLRAMTGADEAPIPWQRLRYGPHARQYLLHATPPHARDAPLAVYLHGGGWQFGSPELLQEFGAYFYRRGYRVAMLSYRRLFRFHGEDIYADAVAALRASFGESPPPTLLLAGVSAGGTLAALLALRQNRWRDAAPDTEVGGLVACCAPLSLADMALTPTRERFAGRPHGRRWRELDPLEHLTHRPDFPAVVVHGERDALVPVACSRAFVARGRALGWAGLDYHELPGGGHLSAAAWVFGGGARLP